jgi:excisionase family DNA binding protein
LLERVKAYDHALSARELAPLLGSSGSNLYSMARAGRIPHIRFGGSIRFDPHVTAKWIREHEVDFDA